MKRTPPYLFLLVSTILCLDALPAAALPAFARREGVKCQMCHFRVPELNEDGRAYLLRGVGTAGLSADLSDFRLGVSVRDDGSLHRVAVEITRASPLF